MMRHDAETAEPDEERTSSEDGAEKRRVKERVLTPAERERVETGGGQPGAEYLEKGWRKRASEPLRSIHAAIDQMRDSRDRDPETSPSLAEQAPEMPAGLRASITEALGAIAYVQLRYSTKEHHVCHAGLRTDDGVEDTVVLVGPETVDRFETVSEAIDEIIGSTSIAEPVVERAPAEDVFGRVYEVEEIEGIGDTYGPELEELSITTTRGLHAADPAEVSRVMDVSPTTVVKWQSMAELMAVNGIGQQYAELLVRSGIRSIDQLAEAEPASLLEAIQETENSVDVRIQGNKVGQGRVANWIELASQHDPRSATREDDPPE